MPGIRSVQRILELAGIDCVADATDRRSGSADDEATFVSVECLFSVHLTLDTRCLSVIRWIPRQCGTVTAVCVIRQRVSVEFRCETGLVEGFPRGLPWESSLNHGLTGLSVEAPSEARLRGKLKETLHELEC